MKLLHIVSFLLLMLVGANAAEFRAYRATVMLPFVNSVYENDKDLFVNTRLSSKQLVNLALGQPFKGKVAKELALVILVPSASTLPLPVSLVVLNTETHVVVRNVASFAASNVLVPDDVTKPVAGLVSVNFSAMSNADFVVNAFTLAGSGTGSVRTTPGGLTVAVKLGGLHGEFTRTHPVRFFYAGVIPAATIRASGKPVAILNL